MLTHVKFNFCPVIFKVLYPDTRRKNMYFKNQIIIPFYPSYDLMYET